MTVSSQALAQVNLLTTQVPFVPAALIPEAPTSQKWALRHFSFSSGTAGHTLANLNVETGLKTPDAKTLSGRPYSSADFSKTIWQATKTTPRIPVYYAPSGNVGPQPLNMRGKSIPIDPSWYPSGGSDSYMIVRDVDGTYYYLFETSHSSSQSQYEMNLRAFQDANNMLSAASYWWGTPFPYGVQPGGALLSTSTQTFAVVGGLSVLPNGDTFMGNCPGANGGGTPEQWGHVTPQALAAGVIPYALKMQVANNMAWGPSGAAPADVLDFNDPRVGVSQGVACSPAGKIERAGWKMTADQLAKTTPEVMRVRMNLTPDQIEKRIVLMNPPKQIIQHVRTILTCFCDYGWMITDSNADYADPSIPFDSHDIPALRSLGFTVPADYVGMLKGFCQSATELSVLDSAYSLMPDGKTWTRRETQSNLCTYQKPK